jgi:hypothetical protein
MNFNNCILNKHAFIAAGLQKPTCFADGEDSFGTVSLYKI